VKHLPNNDTFLPSRLQGQRRMPAEWSNRVSGCIQIENHSLGTRLPLLDRASHTDDPDLDLEAVHRAETARANVAGHAVACPLAPLSDIVTVCIQFLSSRTTLRHVRSMDLIEHILSLLLRVLFP